MSSYKKMLVQGASGVFIVKLGGSALALVSQILLARLLGVDAFGPYTYVLTWMNFLMLLGRMGTDTAAQRFIASYQATSDWQYLRGFVFVGSAFVLATCAVIVICVAGCVFFFAEDLGSSLRTNIWVACLILPIGAYCIYAGACLQGLKKVVTSRAALEIVRPALLIVALILNWQLSTSPLNGPLAMWYLLGSYAVTAVVLVAMLSRTVGLLIPQAKRRYQVKHWLTTSAQLVLISGLHLILSQTDIVMLGLLENPVEAGKYAVASRISTLVVFGLFAINTALAPLIADLYAKGDTARLQSLLSLAARGIFAVTATITTLVVVFRFSILALFGDAFTEASTGLVILLGGQLTNALVGSVGYILMMSGNQSYAIRVMGLGAASNITLNVVLIPAMGSTGAATATAITTAGWNIALAIIVRRKLGLNASVL